MLAQEIYSAKNVNFTGHVYDVREVSIVRTRVTYRLTNSGQWVVYWVG